MKFVPHGAVIIYPGKDVHEMLGYNHPGSTRKDMTKRGSRSVQGYPYEDVLKAIAEYTPDRSWPRTKGARTRTYN